MESDMDVHVKQRSVIESLTAEEIATIKINRRLLKKCTIYMRQSKRFKLTKPILKTVIAANDLEYDFGNISNPIFSLIEEEDVFVLNDDDVDIDQLTGEFLKNKVKDIDINTPKITGRLVLPDKKPKLPAPNKKIGSETETSEDKTEPVDKESTSEAQNNKTPTETEPLEALGLRKVTKS